MQRKIIALVVAGVASGGAVAQSSVTIFGLFDVSLVTNSAKGRTYGINSSAMQASSIGFRGTEDLGNGLRAFFNLKESVNLLTGGTGSSSSGATTSGYNNFNSSANVGLAGSFGTIIVGRQVTPVFATMGAVDVFNAASGGIGQQWAMGNVTGWRSPLTSLVMPLTSNNAGGAVLASSYAGGISYTTPNLAGFQAKVFVTAGNNITGAPFSDNGIRELGASYNNGSISANWAYNSTSGKVAANAVTGVFPRNITESTHNVLGGSYKFGGLKFAAAWFKAKYDATLQATNHDNSGWTLGATYQTGPTRFGLEYTAGKDDIVSTNKDNILSFLADYTLSKRTNLYAMLATVGNSGNASVQPIWTSPSLNSVPGNALDARGIRDTSLVLGMRHSF